MAIRKTDNTEDVVMRAVAPSDIAQILSADNDDESDLDVGKASIIKRGFSSAQISRFETVKFITNLEKHKNNSVLEEFVDTAGGYEIKEIRKNNNDPTMNQENV